jgi:hypothetical protein
LIIAVEWGFIRIEHLKNPIFRGFLFQVCVNWRNKQKLDDDVQHTLWLMNNTS